jgi:hypothetical protein
MNSPDGCNRLKVVGVRMMQRSRTFIGVYLLVGSVFAQTAEDAFRSKLTSVHYAPLAQQARIQGDVRLSLNRGIVTLVSGHPLLAPIAVASAKAFGLMPQTNFDVTYHFVLVDTATSVPTVTTVKRGNAFERAMMRVFGLKTEKVVHGYRCESGDPPANDVKINGAVVAVWIYGRISCPELNTSTLVARH